ncbi:hypothetical protein TNCV_192871 [Trichonephila clavipes]|nr:hypothetical protein TNCV_192871 [Trichonephila clavipes]
MATSTAIFQLFFNIATTRIETFVVSWDQLLYPSVVELCRLCMELPCDKRLLLFVVAKTPSVYCFITDIWDRKDRMPFLSQITVLITFRTDSVCLNFVLTGDPLCLQCIDCCLVSGVK